MAKKISLTKTQLNKFHSLYEDGTPASTIAKKYGLAYSTVYYLHRKHFGASKKRAKALAKTRRDANVA